MTVAVRAVAEWPEVARALEGSRDACTRLRFHEGLRRRISAAAAESRVRGAWANAELDGARSELAVVRELVTGARAWPADPDPAWGVIRGGVQVTAEAEHAAVGLPRAPQRALARLHLAAAAPMLGADELGRPRRVGEPCAEYADLGPAPEAVDARLRALGDLLALTDVPALVVAALAHAEVACARPFVRGNGLVARALERCVVIGRGLDPTGVSVPEVGHLRAGSAAYIGALLAYAGGTRAGLSLWMSHCGGALTRAAQEGESIAEAVRRGRLG